MTMLVMDSIHGYAAVADTWSRISSQAMTLATSGGGGIDQPFVSCTGNSSQISFQMPTATGLPKTVFLGMWYNVNETEGSNLTIRYLDTGGTRQGGWEISQSGGVNAIRSNSTIVASAQNVITPGTWNFVECKYRVDNTTGDYIFKVNGEEVLKSTGQDSQGTGVAQTRHVLFDAQSGLISRVSHIWIWDDQGSVFNDFIGPRKLVQLYPSAAGGNTDWTRSSTSSTNWELVLDDPVTSTDFVEASSTGATDQHQFDDLPANVTSLECVQVTAALLPTDGNALMVEPFLESTGTEVNGKAQHPAGDSRTFVSHIFETDPNAGGAWTVAALDIARCGIRTVASTN